jgi:hypothetical protein
MIANPWHVFPGLLTLILAGMVIGVEPGREGETTRNKNAAPTPRTYQGKWVEGVGDAKRLKLIDQAFESIDVSAKMVNLAMNYKRDWDGLILSNEAWPAWWIQNTYGPSYGMMPFLEEPYATWMKNAQGMWFREMADGKRKDTNGYVAPNGSLCDCTLIYRNGGRDLGFGHSGWPHSTGPVNDGKIKMHATYFRQGDGGHGSNDWGIGFTAAGLVLECERLLVSRDRGAIEERLPQLRRVAGFLDARRDKKTNLLKGGKGSNLLAPGFDGYTGPDGKKQLVYLTELSVSYCAGLNRLAEVCDIIGEKEEARGYRAIAGKIRTALPSMMDDKGTFIMFKDPEGIKHGVYGAEKYGYFEATPNHDAVCMRVVDDAASKKIIERMVSIKGLAPHDLILSNYPAYDEPAYPTAGLMRYGTWVHGGHWSTTQGRMNVACLRVDEFDHPFKSWDRMCKIMQNFRADAPFGERGLIPWGGQMGRPYNNVMDCWGVPAGVIRGLFEYDYRSDGLRVRPHLPSGITRYVQKKAVMFGGTRIYLTVTGSGKVTSAKANGKGCGINTDGWINLKSLGEKPVVAVEIIRGKTKAQGAWKPGKKQPLVFPNDPAVLEIPETLQNKFHVDLKKLRRFYEEMVKANLDRIYEGAMAKIALSQMIARYERRKMRKAGMLPMPNIKPLPPCNPDAVEDFYATNALQIAGGLTDRLSGLTIWEDVRPNAKAVEIAKRINLFPSKRTTDDLVFMMIPGNKLKTRVGTSQGGGNIQAKMGRISIFTTSMTADEVMVLAGTREALKKKDKTCLYTGVPAIGSDLPLKYNWTNANQLTMEVWIKPAGHGRILDKIAVGGSNGFLIDLVGSNQVRTIIGARFGGQGKNENSAITLNKWTHVALVLNQKSRNAVVYINGKRAYEIKGLPLISSF